MLPWRPVFTTLWEGDYAAGDTATQGLQERSEAPPVRGLELSLRTPAPTTGELQQALLSPWGYGQPSYMVIRPFLVSSSHTAPSTPQMHCLRMG